MGIKGLQNKTLQLRARLDESRYQSRRKPTFCTDESRPAQKSAPPINTSNDVPSTSLVNDTTIYRPVVTPREPAGTTGDAAVLRTRMVTKKPDVAVSGSEQSDEDKRRSNRKSTVLAGVVCNDGSKTPINVVIKDMSATGTRFCIASDKRNVFSSPPKLSEYFQLYVTYDRMTVRCKLQWQKGNVFGAKYLAAPQFY